MDHEQQQHLAGIITALQQQVAQLQHQQEQQHQDLRNVAADRTANSVDLHSSILGALPQHFQLQTLDAEKRRRLLAKYPKTSQLAKPLRDDNGLASGALGEHHKDRKWILTHLPQYQRDNIDALRVAATGWNHALAIQEPQERAKVLLEVLRDVAVLTADNCAKLADVQLRTVFEAAGAKGALSFLNLKPAKPDDLQEVQPDIDIYDNNIIQQSHIEAMSDLRTFTNKLKPQGGGGRGARGGGRGGGRGYGGRGNGKGGWRDYSNGYGGRGGKGSWRPWGNGGKGGKGNNRPYNNSNNSNSNNSDSQT
jgi:hypothetical protein